MARYKSWLPDSRVKILTMAKSWIPLLNLHAADWGISESAITAHTAATAVAEAAYEKVQNTTTRNHEDIEACNDAFKALCAELRDMKKRHFFMPPLSLEQWRALLLPDADEHATPIPTCPLGGIITKHAALATHLLEVSLAIDGFLPEGVRKSWYTYCIHYCVSEAGQPVPTTETLPSAVLTKRKKHTFNFPGADVDKRVYFAVNLVNSKGYAGPMGPLYTTVVP